ncbi:MAG: NAD(P)/FAD-dependent oxidoreductase, partial [Bacteroidota bacterium]
NDQGHYIDDYYDVVIVGAGPAGLGIGIILQQLGIYYVILEKSSVGASFRKWPKETRFISPSFTGNFFKMPDLNAITPNTSPAFELLTEHPTGNEYANHLQSLSKYFHLAIDTNVEVKNIENKTDSFVVNTTSETYGCKIVIWAAGEYQYPKKLSFEGDHRCAHYSEVSSFSAVKGKESVVIGAYESGFDAAVNLVNVGKRVTLIDDSEYLDLVKSDSSYSLSPYTRDRIKGVLDNIAYHKKTRVEKVEFDNDKYIITTDNGKTFSSDDKPINCTGFGTSLKLVRGLFHFKKGYPLLTDCDESRKTKNLFLVGPQVKHGDALFCFIYKYRQRFAIVAEKIAERLKVPRKEVDEVIISYKNNNFYLDDLDCCDDECVC